MMAKIFGKSRCFLVGILLLGLGGSAAYAQVQPSDLSADMVEYNSDLGTAKAAGNVLLKRGTLKISGNSAMYNMKSQEAWVQGNVIVIENDVKITCESIKSNGQGHMSADGNVQGKMPKRSFQTEHLEYYPMQRGYVMMPSGGSITHEDGTFSANQLEGWLDDSHYVGTGNAHIVSSSRNMEAGGEVMDYNGTENGKLVVTGNAWAYQENNTLKGNRITVYLGTNGNLKAEQ